LSACVRACVQSLTTHLSAEGIEECRRCLGGHGFLLASGIPELYTTFLQQVTVEGENWLLVRSL
jgi:acyl-CoA oxidase